MVGREAFINCIIENPADDNPRLVMADWLEENGECDAAEFIRVQIELNKLKLIGRLGDLQMRAIQADTPDDEFARVRALAKIESRLMPRMSMLADLWAKSLGIPSPGLIFGRNFGRGFIESITIDWADWERAGDRILETAPVTNVALTGFGLDHTFLADRWKRVKNWTIVGGFRNSRHDWVEEYLSVARQNQWAAEQQGEWPDRDDPGERI